MSAIDDVIEYVQTYGYKEEAMTARKAADQLAALRAELAAKTKAVEEARGMAHELTNRDERRKCEFCNKEGWGNDLHEQDCPFSMAYAWLTAHPEGKEE